MSIQPEHDQIYARVCEVILQVTCRALPCAPEARLIDDLGLDSLKFVDLTVAVETAFGFDEFPMQAWLDDLSERGEPITLAALTDACRARLLEQVAGIVAAEG